MSLVKCEECDQMISDKATVCPHCGHTKSTVASESSNLFEDGPSGRNRAVAGLLAILLGCFGIHYFYCGKSTAGIVCILLTLLSCGVLGAIIGLITFVQGIMMLVMSQQEFERKYINTVSKFPLF